MELTRRGWAVAGCGVALVAGSVLFATPALLYAAAAVGALLLGVAAAFVRRFGRTLDSTSIDVELDAEDPLVDARTKLTLRAERSRTLLPMRVALPLPEAADTSERVAFELDSHETVRVSQPITWSVAGTYRIGPPRVTATDPLGLVVAGLEWDADRTVRVRARQPETVHLGEGGSRVAAAFGEHRASQSSTGIEPAKLRRYEPGAQINRIDWKATARLDDVFVVDPETETHRQTVLLVDHRATTDVGVGTETALAYLRHAALAIVGSARDLEDPLGLYAVGDSGVTVAEPPDVGPRQYATIEDEIRDLEASRPPAGARPSETSPVAASAQQPATGEPSTGARSSDVPTGSSGEPTGPSRATTDSNAAATGTPAADAGAPDDVGAGATSAGDVGATTASDAGSDASASGSGAGDVGTLAADSSAADDRGVATEAPTPGPTSPSVSTGPTPYDRRTALGGIGRDASFDVQAASRLSDGSDDFSRRLLPYFEDPTQYLHRVQDDPLFAAARTYLERIKGSLWTVIVTDDSRRGELRETVKLARSNDERVLVVIAPRVLFEPSGLADVERAYDRYRDFEEFRRDLASMNRVDALELAPGERIEAVLAAGGAGR